MVYWCIYINMKKRIILATTISIIIATLSLAAGALYTYTSDVQTQYTRYEDSKLELEVEERDSSSAASDEHSAQQTLPLTPDNIFLLVNGERRKAGVTELTLNESLVRSAETKARDMNTRQYFGHVDPDGKQGYTYVFDYNPSLCSYASENIAYQNVSPSADIVVKGWMNSPSHRQAILDPSYSYTGIAIDGNKIVQHFCVAY